MIQTVVTNSGNIKGWLIDEYYVPKNTLKFFTPQSSLRGVKIISKIDKSGIRVRGKRYPNILKVINSENCREVLRSFIVNGISLHNILFFPTNIKDDCIEDLSCFWKIVQDLPLRTYYVYKITDSNFKEIGFVLLRQDLYKSSFIYINMLEVIEKSKGIGSEVVNQLKSFNICISGLSTQGALNFWKKLGAEVTDNQNHFIIRGGC